jgi:hypothetical protein
MPICLLSEAFAYMGGNAGRSLAELIRQLRIPAKARSVKDRRNCIRSIEGRLKNFEIFEAFRTHIGDARILCTARTTDH